MRAWTESQAAMAIESRCSLRRSHVLEQRRNRRNVGRHPRKVCPTENCPHQPGEYDQGYRKRRQDHPREHDEAAKADSFKPVHGHGYGQGQAYL